MTSAVTLDPQPQKYGKLIAALTASDPELMQTIERQIAARFGDCELASQCFSFDAFTDYYAPEMGTHLHKKFISFAEMIRLDELPELKHWTNALEQRYAVNRRRRINIDPGYVTHAQMVLATTKAYSHRIYLGKGIYAELTYICRNKAFHPLDWTYPDYRELLAREFFERVRHLYLQHMREQGQDLW
ncbi:DUF4416 family protein [candidate division KSB3 bacterium]|uniref:DUF4416 family protein n=1 Tax=candidate division KSB3 bacterium TaxID=2044937 RepID=A0A9D5K0R8_9BACT|nr:DUF4416 family protein [candidate division KSB3 bacterium]MBD3327516.1 DUF4416 family protein [candidate division KSB3 bacterium]